MQLSSRVIGSRACTTSAASGAQLLRTASVARSYSVSANLRDTVAEGLFDDTQKELKETVHQFAQREIAPLAAELDRKNEFPMVRPLRRLHCPVIMLSLMSAHACRCMLSSFINLYKSITNQFLLLTSFLLQHLWRKLGEQSLLGITADRMTSRS